MSGKVKSDSWFRELFRLAPVYNVSYEKSSEELESHFPPFLKSFFS